MLSCVPLCNDPAAIRSSSLCIMHSHSDIHGTLLTIDACFHLFFHLGSSQQPSTAGTDHKCFSSKLIWAADSRSFSSSNKRIMNTWSVAAIFNCGFVHVWPGDSVPLQQRHYWRCCCHHVWTVYCWAACRNYSCWPKHL